MEAKLPTENLVDLVLMVRPIESDQFFPEEKEKRKDLTPTCTAVCMLQAAAFRYSDGTWAPRPRKKSSLKWRFMEPMESLERGSFSMRMESTSASEK